MTHRLKWPDGEAGLQNLGAMIDDLQIRLPSGRMVEPLAKAPWAHEPGAALLPGILRQMRGEWPCVPFGMEEAAHLPKRWPSASGEDFPPHGYGSNNHWINTQHSGALVATIDYPNESPIQSLRRVMRPSGMGVELELTVLARLDCDLPIALHPVLNLPQTAHGANLDIGPHTSVWSHPIGSAQDPCPLTVDTVSPNITAMIRRDGGTLDLSRLPLDEASECRVFIPNASGRVVLDHGSEGWSTVLTWNTQDFPSLMLWVSNRGRQGWPWSGRHLAIGVEPCRAAFDLGPTISASRNPLNAEVPTTIAFKAGVPWHTSYRIAVVAAA